MLDFIYYPVSFILWCWHQVFGFLFSYESALAWVLAIAFLTFTVRGIMFKPFVNQVRSMKKMQDFAPEMKKVQKKYANDKQRQAQEMQKLQREHGVNPLGSCLPMLLQIPVFIGLNWVLRAFQINPYGTVAEKTGNYFFGEGGVESYNAAEIFGVGIGDAIHRLTTLGGSVEGAAGWNWEVGVVAFPLAVVAAIATHFTAKQSAQRQTAAQSTQQAKMMQNITMWVFPFGLLVIGAFVPVGLLIYFLANNGWTLMQQRVIYRKIDREEDEKKVEAVEKRTALAPKPGQKPAAGQKPAPGQKPASGQGPKAANGQESGQKSAPKAGKAATGNSAGTGGGSWAKGGGAARTSAAPQSKSGNQQKTSGSGKSSAAKSNAAAESNAAAKSNGSTTNSNGSGKSNSSSKQNTASSKKAGRKRR